MFALLGGGPLPSQAGAGAAWGKECPGPTQLRLAQPWGQHHIPHPQLPGLLLSGQEHPGAKTRLLSTLLLCPPPPASTVATSSLIPQTTCSTLCASLLEMHTVCHSILEWKVTIEITIQHGYFYFTYLHEGDNPCRSVLLCKNSTLVNRSEMPGVCACTKGTGMIISKELFPKETSTCAGETTLSLRDMQD